MDIVAAANAHLNKARTDINNAADKAALEAVRVAYLGKKGAFTLLLRELGRLDPAVRGEVARTVQAATDHFKTALHQKKDALATEALAALMAENALDVSLPGHYVGGGTLHPISQTIVRITDIFATFGFEVVEGPEIENDYYNFTALNIPANHPARTAHDTFYINPDLLLRTHTSSVQIRTLEATKPPVRIIAPGRVYRYDYDPTHSPMFHQVEFMLVDKAVNFGNLKHILECFLKAFFEDDTLKMRFRPSYFPFTEPSMEVDIQTPSLGDNWIEVLGCGMMHPNVLTACKVNPTEWQAYAAGLGVERLAMLYYGVSDLRPFFENDVAFLRQFS